MLARFGEDLQTFVAKTLERIGGTTRFKSASAQNRGAGGLYGLPFGPDESRVVVVPVPFEATTSYGGGTSRGPKAVLEASRQVDLYDRETGKPYQTGIAMLDIPKNVARWNREANALAPGQAVVPKHDDEVSK